MPRNQEVIRQWRVLHALESSRHGATIDGLAGELEVTTRTIRRDLAALQEAGFALYDERDDDGRVRWRIDGHVLKGLETGFTLAELCALYLSRNLLESVAGSPFQRDLTNAFERLEKILSPRMRQFLDRLPSVLAAKPGPRARGGTSSADIVARLLEATLHFRVTTMRYHSVSSARVKDYVIHPYRLAFAQGGLYLLAYVPDYKDVRTFAVDRIASASLEKQTFTPPKQPVGEDVFANSLGVNTGPAAPVEIEFDARVAPYVRARVWHASQQISDAEEGGLRLTMNVCHDWALRSWILGWGAFARVVSPPALASDIKTDLQAAAARYGRSSHNGARTPMNRPGRVAAALILVLLVLVGPSLLRFYTDWLWFGEVGYQHVFGTMLRTQGTIFTAAFVARDRLVPPQSAHGVVVDWRSASGLHDARRARGDAAERPAAAQSRHRRGRAARSHRRPVRGRALGDVADVAARRSVRGRGSDSQSRRRVLCLLAALPAVPARHGPGLRRARRTRIGRVVSRVRQSQFGLSRPHVDDAGGTAPSVAARRRLPALDGVGRLAAPLRTSARNLRADPRRQLRRRLRPHAGGAASGRRGDRRRRARRAARIRTPELADPGRHRAVRGRVDRRRGLQHACVQRFSVVAERAGARDAVHPAQHRRDATRVRARHRRRARRLGRRAADAR